MISNDLIAQLHFYGIVIVKHPLFLRHYSYLKDLEMEINRASLTYQIHLSLFQQHSVHYNSTEFMDAQHEYKRLNDEYEKLNNIYLPVQSFQSLFNP